MKKLFLIAFLTMFAVTSQAQLRNVKNSVGVVKSDAAGADTINITPSAYETIVFQTMTDSVHYKVKSSAQSIKGDKLVFVVTGASGNKFRTIPASGLKTTGADSLVTIGTAGRATLSFIFDGRDFIQTGIIKL